MKRNLAYWHRQMARAKTARAKAEDAFRKAVDFWAREPGNTVLTGRLSVAQQAFAAADAKETAAIDAFRDAWARGTPEGKRWKASVRS